MRDWLKYEKAAIFRDKSKGGLLSQFLKEYKETFKTSVIAGCNKCLNRYYDNYIKSITMDKKIKCDFRLLAKYNGIQLGTNGQPIRNGEMTNEIALELYRKHPAGAKLFDKIPKGIEDVKEELTLKELRLKHPDITANSRSKFLEKLNK